jgi:hypothetical protein
MPPHQYRPLSEIQARPRAAPALSPKQRIIDQSEQFFVQFLSGPWLVRAQRCGPRALYAGLLLWWVAGLGKFRVDQLDIKARHREKFELAARDYQKGLRALELSNLVKLERRPGQSSLVTIVL